MEGMSLLYVWTNKSGTKFSLSFFDFRTQNCADQIKLSSNQKRTEQSLIKMDEIILYLRTTATAEKVCQPQQYGSADEQLRT